MAYQERRMSDLEAYRKRRDPQNSPEPAGRRRRGGKRPRFVVQEHSARTHHFDFRLEVGGVLKSWAVPKGPSTDPREKRLAMPVEDHPLDYADFEGVIPAGQYGAGAVVVWDRAFYDNLTERDGAAVPIERALGDGHVVIGLHGKKLKGGYALQRVATGKDERWLLIKLRDEAADARRKPASSEPRSVISGRTLADLAEEAGHGDR
jgi:DNA ligase D-like protein (predicted 3'-phosphoesterase)